METKPSFDLNESVRQWRESLAQSSALTLPDLDELEQHLRDSMALLRERQLSEEESFLIATRRIGGGPDLAREFAKVHPGRTWQSRVCWMVAGVFLFHLLGSLPDVGSGFLLRSAPSGLNGHVLGFFAVAIRWFGLLGPIAALLWMIRLKPLLVTRWANGIIAHPVRAALGLVLVSVAVLGASILISAFVAMKWGIPSSETIAKFQIVNYWQFIGFNALETLLLPVALVWLAHRASQPKSPVPGAGQTP